MNRAAVTREDVVIPGPAGDLQGVLEDARERDPVARAVVCHPHPLYQGTLNNKVTFTLARAAVEAGAAALRFNFRGVGKSAGDYDEGRGEVDDVRAAEAWLAQRYPHLPAWRLGFSFGSAMALRLSREESCAVLVTVAPPAERFGEYGMSGESPRAERWLLVQGDSDDVVDPKAVLAWARRLDAPPDIRVFEGAGHFFHGRLTELRKTVLAFLQEALTGEASA